MKVCVTRPGFTITHDTTHNWLYLTWQGVHSEAESRACCLLILDQVHLTGSTKILNDASLDQDGWGKLVCWIADDFFRALADSGVAAIAWVVPHDLKARIDTEKVLRQYQQPTIDAFTDTEAAYAWLQNLPKPPIRKTQAKA
jgi:hypothetical protein